MATGRLTDWIGAAAPVAMSAVLAACAEGDPGPLGPAGPPGESVRGVSYVAHFHRASELDTWEFSPRADWRVAEGQLVVGAPAGERSEVGPSTTFTGDLDVSVLARPVLGEADLLAYGLRFDAGDRGAYELTARDGTIGLLREAEEGSVTWVIAQTPRPELTGDRPVELRLVIRDTEMSAYLGDVLVSRGLDAGPRTGKIRVFVQVALSPSPVRRDPGSVSFDELWVNAALPLL